MEIESLANYFSLLFNRILIGKNILSPSSGKPQLKQTFWFRQKNFTTNQNYKEKNQGNLQLGTLFKNCKHRKSIFSKLSKVVLQNRCGFATLVAAERQDLRYLTSKIKKIENFIQNTTKLNHGRWQIQQTSVKQNPVEPIFQIKSNFLICQAAKIYRGKRKMQIYNQRQIQPKKKPTSHKEITKKNDGAVMT